MVKPIWPLRRFRPQLVTGTGGLLWREEGATGAILGQRLAQIFLQIVGVLDADAEAD